MNYHTPAGWHEKVGCEIDGPKGRDPDVCDYCGGEFTDGEAVIRGNHLICNTCNNLVSPLAIHAPVPEVSTP